MAERATQPDRPQAKPGWTETDSKRFIDDGAVFVPSREEQIATLCGLIPARAEEAFTVVELGAGAGVLARAVLEAFPRCRYVALDGSLAMRERLLETVARHRHRVEVRAFELAETKWRAALPSPVDYTERSATTGQPVDHTAYCASRKRPFDNVAGGRAACGSCVRRPRRCAE